MRVLVGPRAGPSSDDGAKDVAHILAGEGGDVVSLSGIGVKTLARRLSAAEVSLLRTALAPAAQEEDRVVGYVCRGVALGGPPRCVAVSDHVNLTWRSPLTGPNDDAVGPRFPSMTGIYAPGAVVDRMAAEGIIVMPAVVAGVKDDARLSAFESAMSESQGYPAASSELVPVAIVAAHMGLRMAGLVIVAGSSEKGVGSGRL